MDKIIKQLSDIDDLALMVMYDSEYDMFIVEALDKYGQIAQVEQGQNLELISYKLLEKLSNRYTLS